MTIAPATNHLNISSMIAAKQDKPVQWAKNCDVPLEKICSIAVKHSAKKRKREGTRNDQTKRRFLLKKDERDQVIRKRRQLRIDRQKRLDERLKSAQNKLCRNKKDVYSLSRSKLSEQCILWKAVSTVCDVKCMELLRKFNTKSFHEKQNCLKQIIYANKNLNLGNTCKKATSLPEDENPEQWSSSDEETLDMMRPLNLTV